MKGLLMKDLMCLRKQRVVFAYNIAAVLVLSIMYVLSARFGNIAAANQIMMTDNQLSDIDIKNISTITLILFMLLPIAMVGDVTAIFRMDGKAGFSSVSSVLPLSIGKRVMAKYLTVFIMFGIGILVDLVLSLILSVLTDIISFADFLGIILSAASLMSIYGALAIVFCFLFGYGKEDYAIVGSWAVIFITAILANIKKVKLIFASTATDSDSVDFISDFMNFIKHKYFVLFAIAVIVVTASYFLSVEIAKRKRGVV